MTLYIKGEQSQYARYLRRLRKTPTMKSPAPPMSPFAIGLSADAERYVVSYGEAGSDAPFVRLFIPRELVDEVAFLAGGLALEIAASGAVAVFANRGDGRNLVQASIDALISDALEVLDRDNDYVDLGVLEEKLQRSLEAVRNVREGLPQHKC